MTCQTDNALFPCPQCGTPTEFRFARNHYYPRSCDPCALKDRRARDRLVAERRRRASGVAQIKGTEIPCERCSTPFVRNRSLRAKYCEPCRRVVVLEKANAASLAKRQASGAVMVGTEISCKNCGDRFLKPGPRACYCPPCRELQRRNQLPHLKEAARRGGKNYRERHPERIKVLEFESRQRRKANPAFTINERMSSNVRQSLALGKQGWRWETLVGYTLADLMAHLERQFVTGMTWDNRGDWHIDHITPLSSFRYDSADHPDFRAAWALSNLRPLWAHENLSKNDRRTHLL